MTAPRRVVWSAKDRPACFSTDSEWADWYAFRAGAKFPCVDCTPEHQEKMIRAGRCERPETVFTVRAGDMVGVCSADRGYSVALKASSIHRTLPSACSPPMSRMALAPLSIVGSRGKAAMDERSVMERLSEAKTSSDLSHKHTRCDVDYVAALGAAGIHRPTGSALLDADLSQSADTIVRAYRAAEQIVRMIGVRRNWLMTGPKLRITATAAIRLYMAPRAPAARAGVRRRKRSPKKAEDCPGCNGEGYTYRHASHGDLREPCSTCEGKGKVATKAKPQAYAPKACAECHGSGKRKVPARYNREIRDVLAVMESRRRAAGVAVRKQMGVREEIE